MRKDNRVLAPKGPLHKASYKAMLAETRRYMSPTQVFLSKLVHVRTLEGVVDWVISRLLRPYAILGGGLSATIGLLALYSYARFAGFALSGSELLILFVIGWVMGLIIDHFKRTGKP
jgi:hypothetical protein